MKKDIAENVIDSIGKLPKAPAIYIMYGGRKNRSPAYVGSTKNFRARERD